MQRPNIDLGYDAMDLRKDMTMLFNQLLTSCAEPFTVADWDDYYNLMDDFRPIMKDVIKIESRYKINLTAAREGLVEAIGPIAGAMTRGTGPDFLTIADFVNTAIEAVESETMDDIIAYEVECAKDDAHMQVDVPFWASA